MSDDTNSDKGNMSNIDVVWIEAAEDVLHDTGNQYILASVEHVDWLASHLEKMSTLSPVERQSYHTQFMGVGMHGSNMAAAMREWARTYKDD